MTEWRKAQAKETLCLGWFWILRRTEDRVPDLRASQAMHTHGTVTV